MRTVSKPVGSNNIRPPAVAGTFYPAQPLSLQRMIEGFLADANRVGPTPKAIIVPHAGYIYSGPVAASAYALLQQRAGDIERVVLLGPSHHVPFYGIAAPRSEGFATPLGVMPVDQEGIHGVLHWPQLELRDDAHRLEHSIEVQLPFLQMTLGDVPIIPLVIGNASATDVAEVLEDLWKDDRTAVVVSSDLSHYHDYWTARAIDSETTRLIESGQWQYLSGERACGYMGIRGLLKLAADRGLNVKTVDLRNSGDTSGDKLRVVGYGSYVVY
ncbi:MAG: AmmeMemoRadiSam system protein B [Planctomycetota bacterium]|nr:MAG: AmmeMemoRadiSam system protein B [Planctomycetota bacterium]